jgi:hypothetical protein
VTEFRDADGWYDAEKMLRVVEVAALVRAIRTTHASFQSQPSPGGIGAVMFTIRDIHAFAERLLPELVREGVTVQREDKAA